MRNIPVFLGSILLCLSACTDEFEVYEMGNYAVHNVSIGELSGLCLNREKTALLSCGDKGVVKSISFDGVATDIWSYDADMEGISINPSSGDIYLAIEGKQEVHVLHAPDYSAQEVLFTVQEAVDGKYSNNGIEAVEYYRDDILFVGSQKGANLWQYRIDGTMLSRISLSSFASEIAGLCYDSEADRLWVADSKKSKIFLCTTDGSLIATYDVPFISNAEALCVDRAGGCVWVGSDEKTTRLYRIEFRFR